MEKNTIILIVIILVIGILIGYFLLPTLIQSTGGIGEDVFGTSSNVSPPTMPP